MVDETAIKKNRSQVVIMLITFPLLSVGAAWILFYLAGTVTLETTNHGEFVDELRVADLEVRGAAGEVIDGAGAWWIWLVDETCGRACEEKLTTLRQLHALLNDDASRVRRALVVPDPGTHVSMVDRFPQLLLLRVTAEEGLVPGVYIVDPLGNVVFRYAPDTEPKPVLEDLRRLLKVSQIG